MNTKKQIGIWMDHAAAHILEPKDNAIKTNKIKSDFTTYQREHTLNKNENLMHNKEQHLQAKYYENIKHAIMGHDEVLIFGPTTAGHEFLNILKTDHHFDKVKVEVKQSDNMTENQQHAFVKHHFKIA